jgi:hypothetical protein
MAIPPQQNRGCWVCLWFDHPGEFDGLLVERGKRDSTLAKIRLDT